MDLKLKERKKLRLKDYDYSSNGAYFVTICPKNKGEIFGTISENDQVFLNDIGLIVKRQWEWLAEQYSYIRLDEYIVMPDHFHGIIFIDAVAVGNGRVQKNVVGNSHGRSLRIKPIYELIGAFKTTSSKMIHKYVYNDFKWQKSFYDRIIRDGNELYNVRNYIKYNALKEKNKKFDINDVVVGNSHDCSLREG